MVTVKQIIDEGLISQSEADDLPVVSPSNSLYVDKIDSMMFANFFYLHGDLEDHYGYDCINADIDFFANCLQPEAAFPVRVRWQSSDDDRIAICFTRIERAGPARVRGLIISPDQTKTLYQSITKEYYPEKIYVCPLTNDLLWKYSEKFIKTIRLNGLIQW